MSDNKLFLEELKYLVENELSLNEYVIDQLEERFNKNPFLIIQIHQILVNYRTLLPFLNDIESVIYDYIVNTEMLNDKTYYGATLFVADLFDTTQTYIKCKVSQTDKMLKKIS
ncbi:hypothetical protein FS935_05610 [Metabacillus litoralis]|uniref:Uncharacterized protein n=1 Tax=Metabacillus litoralis TaxID=152268 RepID=A0A5C6W3E5_9BACI|nr:MULTISPECIES: hypothetical protein [Metabacillus]MBM7603220.1 hypothetical protein [Metabacillus crassostreae]TXC91860.1 hypothetical protein FS935_05610 [Metabacillus litoralis]